VPNVVHAPTWGIDVDDRSDLLYPTAPAAAPHAPAPGCDDSAALLRAELARVRAELEEVRDDLARSEDRAERERLDTRARLAAIVDIAPTGIWETDEHFRIVWANEQMRRLHGRDLVGASPAEMMQAVDSDDWQIMALVARDTVERGRGRGRLRVRRHDGTARWHEVTFAALTDADGTFTGAVGTMIDVHDEQTVSEELASRERRFRALVAHASHLIFVLDVTGRVEYVSPSVEHVLGYTPEEMLGQLVEPLAEDAPLVAAAFRAALDHPGRPFTLDARAHHKRGGWRWIEATFTNLLDDPDVRAVISNARDVTERREAEAQLELLAYRDPLTALPNRALLLDRIDAALTASRHDHGLVALLLLDLDHFKVINDSMGHEAGDVLLCAISERLRRTVRPGDTVGRLGGDEFVVLCDSIEDDDTARAIAQRLADALSEPFTIAGREIHASCSVGVAIAHAGTASSTDLLRDADSAAYRAKELGRGRCEFFDDDLRARADARLDIEAGLRHAVERDEIVVHYQPIIDVQTGTVNGFEALVRWRRSDGELLMPGAFLDVAESSGLIVPIGEEVLRQALGQLARWIEVEPDRPPTISVNLAPRQLNHPGAVELVRSSIAAAGVPAELVIVEITETALMEDVPGTMQVLTDLRALGVRLAIDDFGTGYSSLAYLRQFDVDVVKIDRSFVHDLGSSREGSAIVAAVTSLARALGLSVVAEGVETVEHLASLFTLGCDKAQGYFFSRPVDGDAATQFLCRHRVRPAGDVESGELVPASTGAGSDRAASV
jgi:diguanylate cyclase (GGDEF)-like protein/PAS domain S-box-containing protein